MQNILENKASWVLKAAHFASIYDSQNTRISSYNGSNSTIIQDISWHGAILGTSYHTRFVFSVTYEDPDDIGNIDIETTDTNNPSPAFLGTTILKNAALLEFIEEIAAIRGAAVAANAARAVLMLLFQLKMHFSYLLKYAASK